MAKAREQQSDARVVAFERVGDQSVEVALHHAAGRYRLDSQPANGNLKATRVGLAPWSKTLVRCRGIDNLPPADLLRALALLGDGELPERVPQWRRACGALPRPGQGRTALLTAWLPGEETQEINPDRATYATAAAALAYAVSLAEGCAYAADDAQGVLVVAASGPEGLLVRALRERPGVVGAADHIERRLRESASAVGLHEDHVRSAVQRRATPSQGRAVGWSAGVGEALAARVEGWKPDSPEAARAFLLVGAAMLAASDDPAVRALAEIERDAPVSNVSFRERLDAWLASPLRLGVACTACVVLLLFTPLLAAKARDAMLTQKVKRADELRVQYEDAARRASLYRQLNATVWPMTKMLAEVTSAAPVHVVVESIRLDSNATVDIEGFVQVAPRGPDIEGPPETLLSQFEASLNSLGTLGSVTVVRREIVGQQVEFQINARVRNATTRASVPMDYAQTPLAEVLYGQGASNLNTPILASSIGTASPRARPTERPSTSGASDRGSSRESGIEAGRESASDRRPTGEAGPASVDGVPTPLTEAQMDAMDRGTLMNEWRVRNSASRDTKLDEQTRARLREEATALQSRFSRAGGG